MEPVKGAETSGMAVGGGRRAVDSEIDSGQLNGQGEEMKFMLPGRVLMLLFFAGSGRAADLNGMAEAASRGDQPSIQALRAAGPAGLEALLKKLEPELTGVRENKVRINAPEAGPWRAAVEEVSQQRDGWASGLYWFTDLDAAKAEAVRTGRRILSLRLLGNLNEEYCCANSRFFRTVLYANATLSKHLREHYVLHWKSVRPAPLLTIDMGDGRRIKRTITGNSIHYLLDAQGQVLDAFPGIYSPAAFMSALARAEQGVAGLTPEARRQWHGKEGHFACVEWLAAAARAGVYGPAVQESMKGELQAGKVLIGLAKEAFPGSAVGGQGDWALMLEAEQDWRFDAGKVAKPGDPMPDALKVKPRQNSKIEVIREFPYPTELDPPKGMVERPLMKQAVPPASPDPTQPGPSGTGQTEKPQVPAPVAAATPKKSPHQKARIEVMREFPYPTEFDPPSIPKSMVEAPPLKQMQTGNAEEALDPASPRQPGLSLIGRMTQETWARIAAPLRHLVELDEASLRFMIQKLPEEVVLAEEMTAGRPAGGNTAFGRLTGRFEEAIAQDMVRNEYYYHTVIRQWLEEDHDGSLTRDVEALNRRVYAELFLTPDYDAWLGLVPEDTYTALEKDGCACDPGAPSMRQLRR